MEAKITAQKDEHIKSVEAEILQLKADIYNLKVCLKSDVILSWVYQTFLGCLQEIFNVWKVFGCNFT